MTGSSSGGISVAATQTSVTFVDDIDGSTEGEERYTFSWLGRDYEIDLAQKSAKKLIDVVNLYTDKVTRVVMAQSTGSDRGRGPASPRSSEKDVQTVRSCAREQGVEVSDWGRGSSAVKEAYDQAH